MVIAEVMVMLLQIIIVMVIVMAIVVIQKVTLFNQFAFTSRLNRLETRQVARQVDW